MSSADEFPLLAYEYDSNGHYPGPVWIRTSAALQTYMNLHLRRILNEKRELRITDTGDLLCFHVKDGKIIYDGEHHYPEGRVVA